VVAVTEFGGSVGVRDRGLLEAALARPLAGFGGTRLYTTPTQRAAALAHALVQNHGFVDGNKRTAMYAMGLWLEREGCRLETGQDELVDFALALAEHRLDVADAADWLEHHCAPTGSTQ
jgi:death on curing protein